MERCKRWKGFCPSTMEILVFVSRWKFVTGRGTRHSPGDCTQSPFCARTRGLPRIHQSSLYTVSVTARALQSYSSTKPLVTTSTSLPPTDFSSTLSVSSCRIVVCVQSGTVSVHCAYSYGKDGGEECGTIDRLSWIMRGRCGG